MGRHRLVRHFIELSRGPRLNGPGRLSVEAGRRRAVAEPSAVEWIFQEEGNSNFRLAGGSLGVLVDYAASFFLDQSLPTVGVRALVYA